MRTRVQKLGKELHLRDMEKRTEVVGHQQEEHVEKGGSTQDNI